MSRFVDLIHLLQQRKLAGELVRDGLAPNRMTLSRWARGVASPYDVLLAKIVRWAETRLPGVKVAIGASDREWAAFCDANVGDSLLALRRREGLLQREVAAAISVSRYTYLLAERSGVGKVADRARGYLRGRRC